MFEGTDSMFNTKSGLSNISYKSFKLPNLPAQNSYCDHRNFDSVNQVLVLVNIPIMTFAIDRRAPSQALVTPYAATALFLSATS